MTTKELIDILNKRIAEKQAALNALSNNPDTFLKALDLNEELSIYTTTLTTVKNILKSNV